MRGALGAVAVGIFVRGALRAVSFVGRWKMIDSEL